MEFTSQDLVKGATMGLPILQQQLGKQTISCTDAVGAVITWQGHDKDELTMLFCLALHFLTKMKDTIDGVQPGTWGKLVKVVTESYGEKLDNDLPPDLQSYSQQILNENEKIETK